MRQIKSVVFQVIVLSIVLSGGLAAEEALYARYPALSPDGNTIAFSYRGDIWLVPSTGGKATRLTVHKAEDIRPQFSPDGKWIMFSSRRFKNYDVFIMPVTGGEPKQLTFDTDYDVGSSWFPAGDSVLFTSYRDGRGDIFKISVDGGMPVKLTGYAEEREYDGRLTADGRYLLYDIGSGPYRWWRRDLRTARNADLFILDRAAPEFTSRRLTEYPNHDLWPVLNREKMEVYFVSARGDWAQVWMVPFAGGDPVQLTSFTGDGVQWLSSNPQGTMLVFEQNFHVWIMDPTDRQPHEVPIEVETDEHANTTETETFDANVQCYSVSPDGKKIAAVIHGEVFVLPTDDPKSGIRVTFTPQRENFVDWGADSRTLYYSSDRNGNYDIYAADASTGKERQLTNTPDDERKPLVSPDGRYLVFYRGLDKIICYDLQNDNEVEWVNGNFFDLGVEPTMEYDWSPDSKWLVFTQGGPVYETNVFVVSLDGTPENISKIAGWNFRPRFSADGKEVYFSSAVNDRQDTYKILLQPEPVEFYEASFDSLFIPSDETKSKAGDSDAASAAKAPVSIDTTLIETRRTLAYALPVSSEYPVLTPDGKKYLFIASVLGKPELWSVNAEGDPDLTQLTHSGKGKTSLVLSSDSKYAWYLEGGKIMRCEIDMGKAEPVKFTATMEVDLLANNLQKFNETWRMLNDYFYDPTFRGTDWNAVREKYEPLIYQIRTEADFDDLMLEMMGELRGSHLDVYPHEPGPDKNIRTGKTGLEIDYAALDRDGVFKVKSVLPESPADYAGIRRGQYLLAVDDTPLSRSTNISTILSGSEGKRVIVTVADSPTGKESELDLKPVPERRIRDLWYENWVRTRRLMVDSLSGGRLAYLHIRVMYDADLAKFRQELVSIAEGKDGLIVDVRNNGGGHIAVHLLGILERTPFVLRSFRDFPVTSENKMRSRAFERPMALLINNYSGSNSEIFAEGFRKLKLGPIIGDATAGGVIGTSAYTLIDGTRVRRPSWGAYTTEMEDTDLAPRQPDIFVEDLPDDFMNGRDPQLVRAVQELMKKLK
jgi:tricorn protease